MTKNNENCQLYAETTWVCFQNILHIVLFIYRFQNGGQNGQFIFHHTFTKTPYI